MSEHDIAGPSSWVARWGQLISRGEVLDVASGSGRHARWFVARGIGVVALRVYTRKSVCSLASRRVESIRTRFRTVRNAQPGTISAAASIGIRIQAKTVSPPVLGWNAASRKRYRTFPPK